MTRSPIAGKVAKIITTDELIINRGSDHGVSKGMAFRVLDPRTEGILDPDTSEDLGSIKRSKTRVWVTEVEPQICLAEVRVVTPPLGGIARLFEPEAPSLPPKVNYLSEVRVGDPVEELPPLDSGDSGQAD